MQISPQELNSLLTQDTQVQLIDVRERWEFEVANIAHSLNYPLQTLEKNLEKLTPECMTVCICHHGVRSAWACQLLNAHGFTQVYNLEGGIDGFACEVDKTLARY